MPVSIVVGGQFGSEGKGKVALELVRRASGPVTVVRVGGPNSGHTAYDRDGTRWALRQLPAGCIDGGTNVVLPAGSFIDPDILLAEVNQLGLPKHRLRINRHARVITAAHKDWERHAGLIDDIGSTGTGVGGAVLAAVARSARNVALQSPEVGDYGPLQEFLCDTTAFLRLELKAGRRVVIEGTQGYGLSLVESGHWPKVTSRYTSAAGALAECGLSPLDVDDVTMVVRSFPIRVAGRSGPLPNETTWAEIAENAGRQDDLREFTTVTNRLRRVAPFDFQAVNDAISANNPSRLVLNHLDYVGPQKSIGDPSSALGRFMTEMYSRLDMHPSWLGFSPKSVVEFGRIAA